LAANRFIVIVTLTNKPTLDFITKSKSEEREMLKRNLLMITAIILGLFLTGSAFAQSGKKITTKRKTATTKGYKLSDVMVSSYRRKKQTTSTSRKRKPKTPTPKYLEFDGDWSSDWRTTNSGKAKKMKIKSKIK
jgi:hypothetical protein